MESVPQEETYVYPELAGSYDGTRDKNASSRKFLRFLAECGIETTDQSEGASVYGFHSFRVSNATYSRTTGKSIADVQGQLGHSEQKTTEGYIQEEDAVVRRRLVAEHVPLPLAGGTPVEDMLRQVEEMVRGLSDDQTEAFCHGLMNIMQSCEKPE